MSRRWPIWAIGALAACFLSVVIAHAYIGSFSRLMADTATGSIAQVDTYPGHGTYPTTVWVYDHVFADTYQLTVPAKFTAARDAEIVLGLYDLKTLQRLPVSGQDTQDDQSWVHFGRIRINP